MQVLKNLNIVTIFYYVLLLLQNYNFVCGSVWVGNLVSDIKGGTGC
jgi:hypothetical protein